MPGRRGTFRVAVGISAGMQLSIIKRLQKNGLSEDATKDAELQFSQITDKFITAVEKHLVSKEKEIMSV